MFIGLINHLVVSSDDDFRWQLKPDVVSIDDQHQIIIFNFRLVVQKVEYTSYFASMAALIPILTVEDFAVINQGRGGVAEDE